MVAGSCQLVQQRPGVLQVAGLRQDDPSQPVQLGLIVALAGPGGGFSRSIQRDERVIELSGPKMGVCDEAEPLGVLQVGTGPVPADQAGAKLSYPFHLLTEADQRKTSAHSCLREPLRHVMFVREVDCRLGSRSRRSKLPAEAMQTRGEAQCES